MRFFFNGLEKCFHYVNVNLSFVCGISYGIFSRGCKKPKVRKGSTHAMIKEKQRRTEEFLDFIMILLVSEKDVLYVVTDFTGFHRFC